MAMFIIYKRNNMKPLKKCIIESLLDDEDEVFDGAKENIIKDFLKTNYAIPSSYTIKETKDGFIVDVEGYAGVTNKNITSLTNGLFEFGEVDKQFYCDGCNSLKSLEGGPKEVMGIFFATNCGKKFTEDDVKKYTKIKWEPSV